MAFITITKTGEFIDVNFGDYSDGDKQASEVRYRVLDFEQVECYSDVIQVIMSNGLSFYLVHAELKNYFIISLVDGVQPTSHADLFTKLKALM